MAQRFVVITVNVELLLKDLFDLQENATVRLQQWFQFLVKILALSQEVLAQFQLDIRINLLIIVDFVIDKHPVVLNLAAVLYNKNR